MADLSIREEEISSSVARSYLDTMPGNRRIRQHAVNRYASFMLSGTWCSSTGEGIKFNVQDELFDGQHRLLAVIQASEDAGNTSDNPVDFVVKMSVIRGASEQAMDFVDTGIVRHAEDVLSLHGVGNARVAASIARLVLIYDEYGLGAMSTPESLPANAEILDFSVGNVELQEAARFSVDPLMRGLLSPRMSGFLYYVFSGIDPDDAESYMNRIRIGANLAEGSTELMIRNAYIANKSRKRGKVPVKILLAWSVKAWNLVREDRTVKQIRLNKKEPWPIAL